LTVSDSGQVTAQGTISPENLKLDAHVHRLSLALAQPFVPAVEDLGGDLTAEITARGTMGNPQLQGTVNLRGLTLKPQGFDAPFTDGVVRVGFEGEQVRLDSIYLHKDNGTVFINGSLVYRGGTLRDVNLKAWVNTLEMEREEVIKLAVQEAALTFRDEGEYLLLDGDVKLGETRLLVDFDPIDLLPFTRKVERPAGEPSPLMQRLRLSLRIRESDRVWLDNNVARLRANLEMGLLGSPAQINLTGRITVEEGYVMFLDRKFDITQGAIDFVEFNRLNPIVDLKAESTVRVYHAQEPTEYKITLALSGPLDELVTELTSDPALDRPDIISLLTLGATREQLAGNGAGGERLGVQDVLLERAGSLSGHFISQALAGRLGLSQVTLEGNLFDVGSENWDPTLLVSKEINPRLSVTYVTNIGRFNENGVEVNYKLTKFFSLEGQAFQTGEGGIDLKYEVRFK
jgi:autotransporter translocation and assembly factor TamB